MSALIIADGFSCREQIRQCSDGHALHLAQVLQMALHQEENPIHRIYPEREVVEAREATVNKSTSRASVAAAAAAGGAALAFLLARARQHGAANGDSADEEIESTLHLAVCRIRGNRTPLY